VFVCNGLNYLLSICVFPFFFSIYFSDIDWQIQGKEMGRGKENEEGKTY
jgi:hypothetical protein